MRKLGFIVPALMAVGLFASRAGAIEVGTISAKLTGVGSGPTSTDADIVTLNDPSIGSAVYAGQIQWNQTNYGTTGAFNAGAATTHNFFTYCIDISSAIFLGSSYNFNADNSLSNSESAGVGTNPPITTTIAQGIENLWYDFNPNTGATTSLTVDGKTISFNSLDGEAIFQLAIWQEIYGSIAKVQSVSSSPGSLSATVMNDAVTSMLHTIIGQTNTVSTLYALDAVGGGQNQSIYQAPVGGPNNPLPLPKASLAGFLLMGGFGLFSTRRYRISTLMM